MRLDEWIKKSRLRSGDYLFIDVTIQEFYLRYFHQKRLLFTRSIRSTLIITISSDPMKDIKLNLIRYIISN